MHPNSLIDDVEAIQLCTCSPSQTGSRQKLVPAAVTGPQLAEGGLVPSFPSEVTASHHSQWEQRVEGRAFQVPPRQATPRLRQCLRRSRLSGVSGCSGQSQRGSPPTCGIQWFAPQCLAEDKAGEAGHPGLHTPLATLNRWYKDGIFL
ncbi:hypothetical protein AJ80_06400 [Polytolypa hystricis UAMH7299]|uniref:Uncharacterized protein n=1 Tax=Polytolypa hystricis (strain UAMH7299) TaxID=1447883 RepID=A0A2B7XWG8_POLH7|nr:hypothetical protein AJ80_06400 [Polytolypa hystricis UAMH7299]